jgi:hypothetical protein
MIQTLTKNWWLLALCGLLEAIISINYLTMYDAGPDAMPQGFIAAAVLLSRLSVAAGVCAIAAGIWRSANGISWPLVLNGLVFSAYGLISLLGRGPLSFRLFAFLIVVMSISFALLALALARTMRHRRHRADQWLFGFAGAASIGFASAFLALANGWIQLERRPFHPSVFLWLCLYFGFSAVCTLGMALRLPSLGPSQSRPLGIVPPLGNPKHAH